MMGKIKTITVVSLVLVISAVAIASGIGTAPVGAQEVPSLPAAYHGEVTLTEGEVERPIQIEVVADGEVQDTIISDANGSFGGPTISDEKMEVQEPDSGQVEFHIGGDPVTIVSVNGDPVNNDSVAFDSGDQEVVLEAQPEDVAPNANVTITGTNSPVESGEDLTANISVVNEGPVEISEPVQLTDFDGNPVDNESVNIPIGESTETTLTWTTDEELDGNGTITARIANSTGTADVEVNRVEPPVIDEPPSGGGGGGGAIGGGGTGDPGETTPDGTNGTDETNGTVEEPANRLEEGVLYAENQTIVSDDGFNLSQVRFTEAASVVSITWEGTNPEGNVTTTTLNRTSNATPAAPGMMLTRSEVTVPENLTNESATIQFRVSPNQLEEENISADELRIYHFADGEWETLSTRVVEDSDDEVRLQTVTPGFSFFAVSAVGEPEADISIDPQEPVTDEEITFDAGDSTDQYGEIVSYEWTINDDSFSGETVTTSVSEPGDVTVELVVENDAGETDNATTSVEVTQAETETPTATETETETTDTGTPGFTVVTAVFAMIVTALVARRQR